MEIEYTPVIAEPQVEIKLRLSKNQAIDVSDFLETINKDDVTRAMYDVSSEDDVMGRTQSVMSFVTLFNEALQGFIKSV